MTMLPDSAQGFAKKFFDKPEGKVGMVVIALLIVGGGILLYTLLPFIITLLQNTIHAIFLFLALAAIIYLITNKQVQALVSYGFKSIMRAITGFFVTIDPIGITRNYISQLRKSIRDMDGHMSRLKGQIKSIEMAISDNTKEIQQNLKMAAKAKELEKAFVVRSTTRKAQRRQESNIAFKDMLQKMQHLYKIIMKIREVTEFMVDDMEDDLDMRIKRYETIRTAHGAFKSAMSAINGKPDERALFEMALEHMEMDVANKAGEMERFIEMSATVIESVDIQNGVYEEDGMRLLEEFEQKGLDALLGNLETTPSGKKVSDRVNVDELKEMEFSQLITPEDRAKGKYFDINL